MKPIDTVIFDVGNVLIRWDMNRLYRQMFDSDDAIAAFLAETDLVRENHYKLDGGLPFKEVTTALAERYPHHAAALLAFDHRWTDCLDGAIEENVEVLRDLKRAGIPTHAITNFSTEKFEIACELFPFLTTFDEIVVSGAVKLVKPDPAIFHLMFERAKIEPARTVFIDDSAANIATAQDLGLVTVHVSPTTDVRGGLRALGLPV